MRKLWRAMRMGFRLTCPACERGAIFTPDRRHIHPDCPTCGIMLYRSTEADWLLVWLSAYTVASVVLIGLIVLFQVFSTLSLAVQLIISSIITIAVVAVGYPRFKGAAVGLLYFLRH